MHSDAAGFYSVSTLRDMFETKFNKAENLLTIVYAQQVTPDETARCEQELRVLLADQKTGFCLLTDMSGLESMDLACGEYVKRVMDFLNEKGINRVVRVIPDPRKDIGLNIMSLFHYRRGVRIVTCETMEEAMSVLGE